MADQHTAGALPLEKSVVVIGAGTMGSGIAEVAAAAGHTVYLRDANDAAVERGLVMIRASLDKRVARGKLESTERDAVLARIRPAMPEGALAGVGLVIEVIYGRTATERAATLGEPVVLFDLALDYASCTRIAIAPAAQAGADDVAQAAGLFAALGKRVSLLADVPGMLVMRTVAMLVNEGAEAVYQGIASVESVDAAMRKGVNYPVGPMAWGRSVGLPAVLTTLRNLGAGYGEDRYRSSVWLQREVQLASFSPCGGQRP